MRQTIDSDALRHELRRRCLTGAQFAQIAGVSEATVSHVLVRGRAGDLTLRKFARALTITPPNPGADAILSGRESGPIPLPALAPAVGGLRARR